MIKNFNEWLLENNKTYSYKEIIDYIKSLETIENDVPDYYFSLMKKEKPNFILTRIDIKDLLEKDKDLNEYVMSGEDRYENSTYEPYSDELYNPIVILNGYVIDGYNRTSTLYRNKEKFIDAYISQ